MNKKMLLTFSLLMFILTTNALGQKFLVLEGNKEIMKGQNKINVLFDYSKLSVGKFDNEADYIKKKKADYNEKEKGRGNKWEKAWTEDREKRYEPQFIENFNNFGEGMLLGDFAVAKYTMTINTTFIEPGFNIYVQRKPSEIDGEIIISETANPNNIVLKISFKNAMGVTFGAGDYDTGIRIQEAYAKLGRKLGKFFN